jgi:cytoskeletal protein CcmA (bactofilin family)
MAETTFQGSQKTHFFALDTSVNNTHIRITLKKATISDTNAVEISRLCAWTARSGDQGRGKELHLPFDYSLRDQITLKDSQELRFGNSSDLVIEHNATNSTITNNTGNISINNNTDDGDIILSTDNGSGGIVEYLRFDGSHTRMTANKNLLFFDNIKADFGTGSDLRIWHDGTNSNISNGTGDLIIENSADDKDIIFKSDDGSGGVTSYITIDGSASLTKFDVNTKHLDNVKATFGDSADLEIYHTGNHSYITDTGTGNLYIRADSLDLRRYANGEQYLTGDANGAVTIFYDGVAKLATKSDGVDITGELQSDSLDVDGAGDISGNLTVGGNTTITGNLTVNGTTVTNSATNTTIEDALIELGSGNTGANSNDLGLILERGTTGNNIFIGWDESEDKVAFGTTTATGSSTGNISYSRADILASSLDLANHIDIADSGKIRLGNSDDMQLYHNGTDSYIVNNTGTLVIDAAGDILADVDGGDVVIRDGGAEFARIKNSSTNFGLQAAQQDKDIVFLGNDGGSAITALTLDMSDAGAATFNHTISSGKVTADTGEATAIPLQIGSSSSTSYTLQRWITSAHSGTEAYIIAYGASNASQANHFAMKNIATGGEIFFELASGVEPLRLTSTEATFSGNVVLGDSDILKLGTGLDLQIYHNGTNSFINNDTGDLFIKNFANDEDIVFQCDDGSGGVATYFQLDGSQAQSRFLRNVKWDDSIQAIFGGSDDLTIQHNGTDSKITNNTGNLEIRNNTNDGDIIFQSDDGSGGITEYFRLDGGTERIEASKSFRFADSVRAQFGASSDLQIYHDGSHTYINNGTGHVYFQQSADDMDIVFQCDNGSGGVTEYLKLDGSATEIDILQHVKIPDGKAIYFGTGNDLNIFHNGSHSYVDHIGTGNLYIRNTTNDADISFQSDDGSGGLAEYFRLDGGLGYNVSPKHILFNDNAKARFGDAGDLDIYHNGSHSNIQDTGTGNLRIAGSIVEITKNDFTETMAKFTQDGAAELYHNNSKKLETTSGGVTVTGNVTHSGLTMTSGTDIDQLTTTTVTATLSTSWQDTGIDGTDLQTGTYIVQVFVDDHSVGGNHYDEYYSGIMSWTSASTNSTVTDEILLHRAGHAPNSGDFFLRTQRAANTDTHDLMLQMRGATSNTGNSDYIFKFRRMI